MKKTALLLLLFGCQEVPELSSLKHPIIVVAIKESEDWGECASVIVRGKDNRYVTFYCTAEANAISKSYHVGDTIR